MAYRIEMIYAPHAGHTVHVALAKWMTDSDGRILLSPECRTIEELQYAVTRLKEDLDQIEREGVRRFEQPRPPLYAAAP